MRSVLKKVVAVGLGVVVCAGMSVSLFAAGASHTIDVTTTKATSTFTYGTGGKLLELELYYEQYHPGTKDEDDGTVYKYVHGSYYTVTATKNNDVGYSITKAISTASVSGTEYSVLDGYPD